MKNDYRKKPNKVAKQIKSPQSPPNLGSAYDLVLADLSRKLTKLKEGVIKLGSLGQLQKKQRFISSGLTGKTYVYYRVSFKASKELKKELDK